MTNGISPRPHRGNLILILGILGIGFSCLTFGGIPAGIVAWILAVKDLKAMDAGEMDPAGHGLTLAGKILGILSVVLFAVFVGVVVLVITASPGSR